MDKLENLKNVVRKQNIRVHAKEAPIYEIIHPQVFNWYHNRKSHKDIRYILNFFKSRSNVNILDLGCGTGFLTLKVLNLLNTQVTAVDISKEMLSILEKRVPSQYRKRLSLINVEAINYMQRNKLQYDLIMASAFLHHLVDLKEFIDLILKNLKSGGILYIAFEPLKQKVNNRFKFMLHRLIRFLDVFIFNLKMKVLKIKIDNSHERSLADYQTTLGGIDPLEIILYLKRGGAIIRFNKFAVRANGFLAFISDKIIRSENTFSLIFKKS